MMECLFVVAAAFTTLFWTDLDKVMLKFSLWKHKSAALQMLQHLLILYRASKREL